ncbi:hypothetical protein LAWI1_G004101 [Lachnellula willkommii]|uniref:F-box domain-containing protein n=1 Tax=Lachnellula willkommii TaxID=215461 RepID=A0A559MFJ2_9HELO|nr:hypothetical protein LAWI1_G004101 [Lachnellula willkommii]
MRKEEPKLEDGEEPLIDTTAALPLRSKRTERRQKKRHRKETASKQHATLWDLPSEILLEILRLLKPSDIFRVSRANQALRTFILEEEERIARQVIDMRYAVLAQCFIVPRLLNTVDEEGRAALLDGKRQGTHSVHIHSNAHKKPYQHIAVPDAAVVCTCLTCLLAWNNLCLVVDFAHWQRNLDAGEPIPMIPRGKFPEWNNVLGEANRGVVEKAIYGPLYYAAILEAHLKSTVGSIKRHGENKGNRRRRFRMDVGDVRAETDGFLERSGPPSLDFPFHRDNYYMLEAYLPNRGWNKEVEEWRYMPASQHERDVEFVKAWARRRKEEPAAEAGKEVS